ncbi:cation:proton antiporter [Roseisolibacter sp. H3M3-2]|uniref:cation:proton antiporter n=1 Tax=Roseisolibacter sp. H3M3-2 TaxID=3031323 RepID=UPI0031F313C0
MLVFEVVIALLLGGAALAAVARRVGAPYPALVALAGAALAMVPGVPTLVLDPELALALFVAPVLVDAAFDSSQRDLRANWRPIASLALGAVALTVVVVAAVARLLVPDMPWAVAIALGAIVAPPDAAAATTVLKALRPPHRLLTILEGESLFNDASALLIYRLAVGAAMAGALSAASVVPTLLVVTVGSVVLALALSRVTLWLTARIDDVSTAVVLQFCSTFLVWILAERLHLSGIITMVVYAMAASRRAAELVPARIRVPAWAVWEVAVFVLNVLAFVLVGFQLRSIAARATGATGAEYALVAVAATAAAIAARIAWVTLAAGVGRFRRRHDAPGGRPAGVGLGTREAAVVGWCGMRGTVTLAAALALPTAFPYRDLILTTAFGVTLGTLVAQGLTLRPLMLRLRLEDDGAVEREVRLARVETLRAGLAAAHAAPDAESASLVRHRYALQLRRVERETTDGDGAALDDAVVRSATGAQRERLVALRADGTIGDAAFQRVEEELDWAEMDWARYLRAGGPEDGRA